MANSEKRANRKLDKIANILLGAGLILVVIPAGFWFYAMYFQWEQTRQWEPYIAAYSKHTAAKPSKASATDKGESSNKYRADVPKSLVDTGSIKQGDTIAYFEIPKLDLKLSVTEGESWANLVKGPVRVSKTARIGGRGTTLISGHRTMYSAPFHNLDKLQAGDEITIYTKWAVFAYEVVGIKKVKPTDWRDIVPDSEPSLVLSTCDPKYSAARRLLVIARLISATSLK